MFLAIVGVADLIGTIVGIHFNKKANDDQLNAMNLKVDENKKSAGIAKYAEDRNFTLNLATALVSAIKV